MTWISLRHAISLPLFLAAIAGCGGGSAPGPELTISNLTWDPKTAPIATLTTFTASLTYEDSERDIAAIDLDWKDPTGKTVDYPAGSISKPAPSGTVSVSLQLIPPNTGRYLFDLWLIDAAGHPSNKLTGTVDAQ